MNFKFWRIGKLTVSWNEHNSQQSKQDKMMIKSSGKGRQCECIGCNKVGKSR